MPAANVLFRCSSIGKLMTEPKTLKEGPLSVGAKTYIRELVAQEIFGVDFEVTSKEMEKGKRCEVDSIALLNRVRGLSLTKNTERRSNGFITGECDLFDSGVLRGHDLKTSWSIATFPICQADCIDKLYEWQMRGYMTLWDADEWEVNYCLVNTPEHLIRFEPQTLHFVDHIPAHMRVTTWTVKRDAEKEAAMRVKILAAREYYAKVIEEFDQSHPKTLSEVLTLVQQSNHDRINDEAAQRLLAEMPVANVVPITRAAEAKPALRLGQINERLGFTVTADFLAGIGFPVVATDKAAKLWHEHQFHGICAAIAQHVVSVANQKAAA